MTRRQTILAQKFAVLTKKSVLHCHILRSVKKLSMKDKILSIEDQNHNLSSEEMTCKFINTLSDNTRLMPVVYNLTSSCSYNHFTCSFYVTLQASYRSKLKVEKTS